jgi:hypothetical protein
VGGAVGVAARRDSWGDDSGAEEEEREVSVWRAANAMEIDSGNVRDAENGENGGSDGLEIARLPRGQKVGRLQSLVERRN